MAGASHIGISKVNAKFDISYGARSSPCRLHDMKTNQKVPNTVVIGILSFLFGCPTTLPLPEPKATGAIAGCVLDVGENPDKMPLVNAHVVIFNSEFAARTGKGGKFIIPDLPPGRHDVRASAPSFRQAIVRGVRVAPDSVTLLILRTYNIGIPEDPLPGEWQESDKRIVSLKEFLSSGGIFDLECKP